MNEKKDDTQKSGAISKSHAFIIVFLSIVLFYVLFSQLGKIQRKRTNTAQPSPPDFSQCTHIEIHATPSMREHLELDEGYDPNFLSPEEYEALENLIIDDEENIKEYARLVNSGSYGGKGITPDRLIILDRHLSLIGYRNEEIIATISIFQPDYIIDEHYQRFEYKTDLPWPFDFVSDEQRPIVLRTSCGHIPWFLWGYMVNYRGSYPDLTTWCDILYQDLSKDENLIIEKNEFLKCPSADNGRCHYAMNPNCTLDSPDDMVLLFETTDGWNQHGGPELFTFDNHDPKGSCVLLNDGTVKFIRTEAELNALRWK